MDPKNPWRNRVENTMRDTEIDEEELLTKKQPQAKKYITEKLKEYQINKIYKAAETKSKVRDYICYKTRATVTAKPRYIDNLNRKECSNIFNTRARMIKIKGNYKNKYTDLSCRWCGEDEETQPHILKYCPAFKHLTGKQHEIYYCDDKESTKSTADILQLVIEKLEEHNLNSNQPQ